MVPRSCFELLNVENFKQKAVEFITRGSCVQSVYTSHWMYIVNSCYHYGILLYWCQLQIDTSNVWSAIVFQHGSASIFLLHLTDIFAYYWGTSSMENGIYYVESWWIQPTASGKILHLNCSLNIFIFSIFLWILQVADRDGKISHPILVEVYYESMCPDSKYFIKKQLVPTVGKISEIVEFKLIPYGKAHVWYF